MVCNLFLVGHEEVFCLELLVRVENGRVEQVDESQARCFVIPEQRSRTEEGGQVATNLITR